MGNRIIGKTIRAINEEFITFDDGSVFLLVGHRSIVEPQEIEGFTVYPHPPSVDCECGECCLDDKDCSYIDCGQFIMKKEKYDGI